MLDIGTKVRLKETGQAGAVVATGPIAERYLARFGADERVVGEADVAVVIERQGRQGDVLFTRVDKLPADALPVELQGGRAIVGHSETGHHHVVDARRDCDVIMYRVEKNPRVCYLQVAGDYAQADHLREFHTHTSMGLLGEPGSIWEITQQEEYTPAGWRQVVD